MVEKNSVKKFEKKAFSSRWCVSGQINGVTREMSGAASKKKEEGKSKTDESCYGKLQRFILSSIRS